MTPSKFGNVRTSVDNITFASKAEARRYQELRLLEKAGEIEKMADLRACPMTELLADPKYAGKLDAIITDPPYPREYLDLYDDLARLAKSALKPGGILAVMVGQSYLPEILELSDRILVAKSGTISAEFSRSEATATKILQAAIH